MQRTVPLNLLFFLFALCAFGQKEIAVRTWLDTQTFEDKQVVRGWCQNENSTAVRLNYQAELIFKNEKKVREGTILASPLTPTLLSKAVFIFKTTEFDTVRLLVFHKNELVASAHILREQPITQAPFVEAKPSQKAIVPSPQASTPPLPLASDIEIDGLVLDETRSKLAHDFYELFYTAWTSAEVPAHGHNITIREMPARIGIGSQVVVEVDNKILTTLNLRPRAEVVENLAKQLVTALSDHFQDPNNFMEFDSDDLNGSGLY